MAQQRRLPALVLPLRHPQWCQLRFDGQVWWLVPRPMEAAEVALARVQVALEFDGLRWLRLRWPARAGASRIEQLLRRWWPHELHVALWRREHAAQWVLIGTALTQHGGRPWLGRH